MAAVIGSLRAELSASIAQFQTDLGKAANSVKAISQEFTKVGREFKKVGDQMQSAGKALTKTLTLPLVALGVAAGAAAKEFDNAIDAIRAGTGATGKDLDNLRASFSKVFQEVPNQAQDVAEAITAISSRTGATGQALEDLATQMANLARVTKTGVGEIAASTTRVFGDWSIATEKQAGSLDFLFRTSQQTGIGIQRLSDLVVQFGAPMRAFGFSFEETSALMGKFEEEGVNLETVMSGLRFALGKFAEAGKEPAAAFADVTERIKTAKTEADATAIAFQTFGKRAAVDMSRAILEGRFNIDELVKSLQASRDTINTAAKDTLSFSEKFEVLKHKVIAVLEPLGTRLLSILEDLQPQFETVVKAIGFMVDAFERLPKSVQTGVFLLGGVAAAIGPIAFFAGQAISSLGTLALAFGKTGFATKAAITGVKALEAALITLRNVEIGTGVFGVLAGGATAGGIGVGIAGMFLLAGELADNFRAKLEAQAEAAKRSGQPIEGLRKGLISIADAQAKAAESGQDLHDGLEVTIAGFKKAASAPGGADDFAKTLAAARKEIVAMGPVLRRDLILALNSGAIELKEIQERSHLSEIAFKLFTEQVKQGAKNLEDAAEAQEKLNQSLTRFKPHAVAIPSLQSLTRTFIEFGEVSEGVLNNVGRAFDFSITGPLDLFGNALKVNLEPVIGMKQTFEEFTEDTDQWGQSLDRLAKSFSQLAQISGGAFAEVVQDIGVLISSMQLALESVKTLKAGIDNLGTSGKRLEGAVGVATGLIGAGASVAQATSSGSIGGRAAKGAVTGAVAGASIGSIVPGIGTAFGFVVGGIIGAITGAVRGIVAKIKKEMQVNPIRADWFLQPGHELEKLNPVVLELTGNLKAVQAVFDARNPEQYGAAIDRLNAILEEGKRRFEELRASVGVVTDKLKAVTILTPQIKAALATVFDQNTTAGYLEALEDLNGELDKQAAKYKTIEDTLKKYGLQFEQAGKSFQQAKLNERAIELNDDFQVLVDSGVDINAQMRAMGPSIQAFVKDAQKAGVEVPLSMQRVIQTAIDAGEIFDEDGNKITNMSQLGLTFGTTMETAMKEVGVAVDRLTLVLEALATFLGIELPKAAEDGADGVNAALAGIKNPKVTVEVDTSQIRKNAFGEGVEGFAAGSHGLRDFGPGQLAVLHGREAVVTEGELTRLMQGRDGDAQPVVFAPQIHFNGSVLAEREYIERTVVGPVLDGIERNYLARFGRLGRMAER